MDKQRGIKYGYRLCKKLLPDEIDSSKWFVFEDESDEVYTMSINRDRSFYIFYGRYSLGAVASMIEAQELDFYYTPKYFHVVVEDNVPQCYTKLIDRPGFLTSGGDLRRVENAIEYLYSTLLSYPDEIFEIDGDNWFDCWFSYTKGTFEMDVRAFEPQITPFRRFDRFKEEISFDNLVNKDILIDLAYIPYPIMSKNRKELVEMPLMNIITGNNGIIEDIKYFLLDCDNKDIGREIVNVLKSLSECGRNIQFSSRYLFELLNKSLTQAGCKVGYQPLHPGELLVTLRIFAGFKKKFDDDLLEKGYLDFDKLYQEIVEIEYFNINTIKGKYGDPVDYETLKHIYKDDAIIFSKYFDYLESATAILKEEFHVSIIEQLSSYRGLEERVKSGEIFKELENEEEESPDDELLEENMILDTDMVS